jgi:hypothetical protein
VEQLNLIAQAKKWRFNEQAFRLELFEKAGNRSVLLITTGITLNPLSVAGVQP